MIFIQTYKIAKVHFAYKTNGFCTIFILMSKAWRFHEQHVKHGACISKLLKSISLTKPTFFWQFEQWWTRLDGFMEKCNARCMPNVSILQLVLNTFCKIEWWCEWNVMRSACKMFWFYISFSILFEKMNADVSALGRCTHWKSIGF